MTTRHQSTAILAGLLVCSLRAGTTAWLPVSGTAAWEEPSNWSHGVPQAGHHAVLANAGATARLSASTPPLASVTLSDGAQVEFANWDTALTATNVTVGAASRITCIGPFHEGIMSNRVWLVCSNLTVEAEGEIDVSEKGFSARTATPFSLGQGPGAGGTRSGGGGFGGFGGGGGATGGGFTYGMAERPDMPGSSGGGYDITRLGGHGGGAIRIDADGDVTVNGGVRANGGYSGMGSGGSGGSVWITCRTLSGTGGEIAADGGDSGWSDGAAAGGGRIAIHYHPEAQAGRPLPGVRLSAARGGTRRSPDIGTIWLTDERLIADGVLACTGRLAIPGFHSWSPDSITVDSAWIGLPASLTNLTVAGDVRISGSGGTLDLGGDTYLTNGIFRGSPKEFVQYSEASPGLSFAIGGDLHVTNGAVMNLYAGAAMAGTGDPAVGAWLRVENRIVVAAGSTLHLHAHPIKGHSPLISVVDVTVAAGGTLTADNSGYAAGTTYVAHSLGHGPGAGMAVRNGAGYGGHGGFYSRSLTGGMPYGSVSHPIEPGSAGANQSAAAASSGGGVIRIVADGTVRIDGTVSASVTTAATGGAGGGSGGAINIECRVLAADGGILRARGGDNNNGNNSGAGGGGRIAIRYDPAAQATAPKPAFREICVRPGLNGISYFGGDLGTIYFTDDGFLGETVTGIWGQLSNMGAVLTRPNLLLTNAWIRFHDDPFTLAIEDTLTVGTGGRLEIGGGWILANGCYRVPTQNTWHRYAQNATALACGGDLVLTNGGQLTLYSGVAGGALPESGGSLDVGGRLLIASNAVLTPISHPTNAASVFMTAGRVSVLAGGRIDAGGMGCAGAPSTGTRIGFGLGGGGTRNGGGYGGAGGVYSAAAGIGGEYGFAHAPVSCGSGGGRENYNGSAGGGRVWLRTAGVFHLDGSVDANGVSYAGANGAGSGGGVLLECHRLTGAGAISARGGDNTSTGGGRGASGGGGRVAVWYGRIDPAKREVFLANGPAVVTGVLATPNASVFDGDISAAGGIGGDHPGVNGSVTFFHFLGAQGTMILLR